MFRLIIIRAVFFLPKPVSFKIKILKLHLAFNSLFSIIIVFLLAVVLFLLIKKVITFISIVVVFIIRIKDSTYEQ